MGKYILKRLGYVFVVFLILSLLMYLVYAMIPFDRARAEVENFKDVYTYADRFPQFNVGRKSKGFMNDLEETKNMDLSHLSSTDRAKLENAIARGEAALENTNVDLDEFEAAKEYFYEVTDEVLYGKEKEYTGGLEFNDYLTTVFKIISDLLYFFFDGAGFSEM